MGPLLRKKPAAAEESFDPVSAATWAAAATATASVLELISLLDISHNHKGRGKELREQLKDAVALTPCALDSDARTKPGRRWSFDEYLLTVRVGETLRKIVVDGAEVVPNGTFALLDSLREKSAVLIISFTEEIEKYSKLVMRERAYERISGQKSVRRSLR